MLLHCRQGEDPGEPQPGPLRQAGGKEGNEQGAMPHVRPNVPPPSPVRRLTDCRTTATFDRGGRGGGGYKRWAWPQGSNGVTKRRVQRRHRVTVVVAWVDSV